MKKQIALGLLLATVATSAVMAGAVESSKEVIPVQTQPSESLWNFDLIVYGWLSSVDGTISAGDRTVDFDAPFKDILSHLDMGVMVAADLRYKRWGLTADLIYARLHEDSESPNGILFANSHKVLKETISTFELNYRVVEAKPAFLDLFAGARVYDFYSQIVLRGRLARGINVSDSFTWADPIVGLRGRYYVSRAVFFNVYGDVGGFGVGSELTWQALGGIGIEASHWCDVELGYRALYFDYTPGRATEKVTTHGPIIGAMFHF